MAEVKNAEQPTLLSKRSSDLGSSDPTNANEPKKQKLDHFSDEKVSSDADQKRILNGGDANPEDPIPAFNEKDDAFNKRGAVEESVVKGEESEAGEEKEEGKEGAEEEEEEDGNSNGKAVIDRKGKGILIEEEEDDDDDGSDDDDDSSDGIDNASDEDSDFVDDPLTEVDLENILPSRTRGRVVHPDAYTASDLAGNDDDDSDDSDA